MLSATFMTDVPLVMSAIWASVAFLRALDRRSDGWLWVAVALSCAAVGIRFIGSVVPVAMAVTLLLIRDGWGRRHVRFLWPMIALVFLALIIWWFQRHTEVVSDLTGIPVAPATRLRYLTDFSLRLLPTMSVAAMTVAAGVVGVALLPLSAAVVNLRRLVTPLLVMAILSMGVAFMNQSGRSEFPLLTAGQTWAIGELGATEPLVPDYARRADGDWRIWIISIISLASASVLATASLARLDVSATFLGLQVLGQLTLMALLWLTYDRYVWVVVPLALATTLRNGSLARPRLAGGLIMVMALLALVGVRDHLQYNRALWT